MGEPNIGEFEELVLLAVCALPVGTYSVPIQQQLEKVASRTTTLGAVHRALARLERKGYVSSWMGEVTRTRGGKRKRLYKVTGLGKNALFEVRQMRERMWSSIPLTPTGHIA